MWVWTIEGCISIWKVRQMIPIPSSSRRFEFQTRARVTITCVDSSDNNSKSVANHTNKKRDCVSVNKISLSLFILATADSLDFSLQRSSKWHKKRLFSPVNYVNVQT